MVPEDRAVLLQLAIAYEESKRLAVRNPLREIATKMSFNTSFNRIDRRSGSFGTDPVYRASLQLDSTDSRQAQRQIINIEAERESEQVEFKPLSTSERNAEETEQ